MRVSRFALLLALALLPGLTACTYVQGDNSLYLTSEPPGARIVIDGQDTGFTTPKKLDLAEYGSHDHEVRLEKRGFVTETRFVYRHRQTRTSRWSDGAVADLNFSWPIFWTFGDFFLPFEYSWTFVPNTVHVDLWQDGRAPVDSTPVDSSDKVGASSSASGAPEQPE